MTAEPYYLRPSVGTWLLPLPRKNVSLNKELPECPKLSEVTASAKEALRLPMPLKEATPFAVAAAAAANTAVAAVAALAAATAPPTPPPPYAFLPSVGTWLVPLPEAAKAPMPEVAAALPALPLQGVPWEANFAEFDTGSTMSTTNLGAGGTPAATISSGNLFKLAPPPSPATVMSVGGATPVKEIVILEEDEAKPRRSSSNSFSKPKCGTLHEELLGTNRADDDDESCLLGDGAPVKTVARAHTVADDIESCSDEEGAPHESRFGFSSTRQPPPPSVDLPSNLPGAPSAPVTAGGVASPTSPSQTNKEQEKPRQVAVPTPAPAPAAAATTVRDGPAPIKTSSPTAAPTGGLMPPGRTPPLSTSPAGRAASQLSAAYAAQAAGNSVAPPEAPSLSTTHTPSALLDFDAVVSSTLDRFFSDSNVWPQVELEVATVKKKGKADTSSGEQRFRVRVPRPYPGVQYRKTKKLDDRYMRYAENESIVSGYVEDNGEWLRLAGNIYLPMRVGAVDILEKIEKTPEKPVAQDPFAGLVAWFSCCSGTVTSDAEVVVGQANDEAEETPLPKAVPPGHPVEDETRRPTPEEYRPIQEQRVEVGASEVGGADSKAQFDLANRHLSDPINPFADNDTATNNRPMRGHSAPRYQHSPPPNREPSGSRSQAYSDPSEVFLG